MIASSQNMLAVLMLVIGVTYSAVIPDKERTRDEVWAEDYNLVEPPPALMLFSRLFDHSKSKIPPQNRLKSVIKAIYQYDTMNNARKTKDTKDEDNSESVPDLITENKSSPVLFEKEEQKVEEVIGSEEQPEIFLNVGSDEKKPVDTETKERLPSSEEEQLDVQGTTQIDVQPTEQTEQTTQKLEVLLEDLVDSIIHVPAHMEGDKAQKFTHSIRYGYGVPFHYNGL